MKNIQIRIRATHFSESKKEKKCTLVHILGRKVVQSKFIDVNSLADLPLQWLENNQIRIRATNFSVSKIEKNAHSFIFWAEKSFSLSLSL